MKTRLYYPTIKGRPFYEGVRTKLNVCLSHGITYVISQEHQKKDFLFLKNVHNQRYKNVNLRLPSNTFVRHFILKSFKLHESLVINVNFAQLYIRSTVC